MIAGSSSSNAAAAPLREVHPIDYSWNHQFRCIA